MPPRTRGRATPARAPSASAPPPPPSTASTTATRASRRNTPRVHPYQATSPPPPPPAAAARSPTKPQAAPPRLRLRLTQMRNRSPPPPSSSSSSSSSSEEDDSSAGSPEEGRSRPSSPASRSGNRGVSYQPGQATSQLSFPPDVETSFDMAAMGLGQPEAEAGSGTGAGAGTGGQPISVSDDTDEEEEVVVKREKTEEEIDGEFIAGLRARSAETRLARAASPAERLPSEIPETQLAEEEEVYNLPEEPVVAPVVEAPAATGSQGVTARAAGKRKSNVLDLVEVDTNGRPVGAPRQTATATQSEARGKRARVSSGESSEAPESNENEAPPVRLLFSPRRQPQRALAGPSRRRGGRGNFALFESASSSPRASIPTSAQPQAPRQALRELAPSAPPADTEAETDVGGGPGPSPSPRAHRARQLARVESAGKNLQRVLSGHAQQQPASHPPPPPLQHEHIPVPAMRGAMAAGGAQAGPSAPVRSPPPPRHQALLPIDVLRDYLSRSLAHMESHLPSYESQFLAHHSLRLLEGVFNADPARYAGAAESAALLREASAVMDTFQRGMAAQATAPPAIVLWETVQKLYQANMEQGVRILELQNEVSRLRNKIRRNHDSEFCRCLSCTDARVTAEAVERGLREDAEREQREREDARRERRWREGEERRRAAEEEEEMRRNKEEYEEWAASEAVVERLGELAEELTEEERRMRG
ncbi:hypothetical protein DFH27DRAFT_611116 [Peziza echinospora]|nr:hypothetical protein DFH27DRAFT_611116 [Peziza echinospora]